MKKCLLKIHQRKTLLFVFCAVLSFMLSLFLSQNSYAIDYTFYQNNPTSYFCHSSRLEGANLQNQCWNLTTPQTVINSGNGRFVYGFALAQINTTGHTYSAYSTMYFDININMTSADFNYYPGNATRILVVTMQDSSTKRADCSFSFHDNEGYTRFECSVTLPQNAKPTYMAFRLGEVTLPDNPIGLLDIHSKPLTINFSGWGYVTSSSEESGYLSQISQQNQTMINQNQTIINQNNTTNNLLQEQNDQQQSQYESEKEEESQREQSAQDSQSGNFLGSIGNLIFPFATMFTTLGTQACFTPTTLNSWLHVTGQSCPLFPASITSAVSSVALVLGSIIIFGFVIRWLNSKENV